MTLAKRDDPKKALATPRRRYSWESETTLVDERKKPINRLRHIFSFWRVLLLVIILLALFNADVMIGLLNFFNTFAASLRQLFAIDLSNLSVFLVRLLFAVTIGIGQFALMFWFLGRARMYTIWPGSTTEGVSFKDYRGQPELLEQAQQIVKLLRGVRVFEEAGGEPLNGLLLEGPPGTGKTWLAQAISTEAGVPFFYLDASSMMSMFFGIAPLKVMNLYRKARNAAKDYGAAIIFIDEIDAIGARGGVAQSDNYEERFGRDRLPMFFGGNSGNMGLLSTLLVEMSGFSLEHGFWARKRTWFYKTILRRNPPKPQKRVLTIGATNRIGALDEALLRPGRFDKKIHVDAPDMEGRRDIIAYYLTKIAHDDSLDPLVLAAETQFYTPADLKYLLNEALRYALFDDRTYITYADFRRAQPEHEMGMRQPIKNLTKEDKYRLAAHEAGHAMAVRLYMPHYRISRITIIRQGGAHGHVSYQPAVEEFDYISTYDQLMNRMRIAVAGKAGELEFVGEGAQTLGVGIGIGDASDFGQIRAILQRMAGTGMFGSLGANFTGTNYTPEMREAMESTFRMVLDDVRTAFRLHHEMGEALIALLTEKEELLAEEVETFFDRFGLFTPRVALQPPDETLVIGAGETELAS